MGIETEDEIETIIEVVDDTPEADRGRPVAPVEEPDGEDEDSPEGGEEELKSYSKRVQDRIKALSARAHSERRAKEALAREMSEMANYAKAMAEESNRLKKLVTDGESVLIQQAQERVRSEMDRAKIELQRAFADGDGEKVAEAQERLARAAAEAAQIGSWRPQPFAPTVAPEPNPVQATPDEKAVEWAQRNPWFNVDPEMTQKAHEIHRRLVLRGINGDSEDYYKRLDEGMRRAFPDFYEDEVPLEKPRSPVAPATRTAAPVAGRRTVKLTASQVSIARRLGITPQQYAAEMIKEFKNV